MSREAGAEITKGLYVQGATSGVWHSHQLYVATPSAVYCVMVASHADSTTPHLEVNTIHAHHCAASALCYITFVRSATLPNTHFG